ncbi:MAG TPA: hypothetical protein VFW60_09630 [Rhodanobacteraceae bacterium]|nr:hypothetical protein [Rhodanobacteraceae bacterium]
MANEVDELAGLPEDVREAFSKLNARITVYGSDDEQEQWETVRAELLRLAHRAKLYDHMLSVVQTAGFDSVTETLAELAALKRKIAEAPKMNVTGSATNTYIDGSLSNWIGQRVALLPLDDGGEG